VSSSAIETLLDAIIPLGTLLLDMTSDVSVVIGSKFVDFLSISSTLAGYSDGSGHIKLMKAVVVWLQTWYVVLWCGVLLNIEDVHSHDVLSLAVKAT
jgi:hypothetical protein